MTTITIADDFSRTPGGRFKAHGRNSGEEFREKLLIPRFKIALQKSEQLVVNFDRVAGLPSSFLEESFGGLVRSLSDFSLADITGRLKLQTTEVSLKPYVELATQYMREADAKRPTKVRA